MKNWSLCWYLYCCILYRYW